VEAKMDAFIAAMAAAGSGSLPEGGYAMTDG
jgi:hypothetical protein